MAGSAPRPRPPQHEMTQGPASNPDQPAAPVRVLPWRMLASIVGTWAALLGPVFVIFGPAFGGVTLLVGLLPGFAGHVVGQRRVADLAGLSLFALIALGTTLIQPGSPLAFAGACLLILGAGIEAWKFGGRAFVLALYGWCALILSPTLPPPTDALPFIGIGLVWGALSARLIGMAERVINPPLDGRIAGSLALFLFVGVMASAQVSVWLNQTYGYWVVLLFVMRALSPPHQSMQQALRYGFGAVVGSGCAFMLSMSNPPGEISVMLAFGLVLVGLRMLPHPAPWSAAAFTSAVLLLVPVGASGIVLRLEATLIAVALTIALVTAIGMGWRLIGHGRQASAETDPSLPPDDRAE